MWRAYTNMSNEKPQPRKCWTSIWTLILLFLLFVFALTAVAMLEAQREESSQQQQGNIFIVSRLWSHFKTPAVNETGDELVATVERIAREATNASQARSNNYYEEQRAVVVNAESQPLAPRQDAFGPPQQARSSSYEEPYYDGSETDDYGAQQSAEQEYGSNSPEAGRAAQARPYNSYYQQWQYGSATPTPMPDSKRKLPASNVNRAPYPAYDEVYDYPMGFQPVRPQAAAPAIQSKQAVATVPESSENTLLTILKSLKQVWDLYKAITSAWNAVAERHQQSAEQLKREQQEKQRLRQQQQLQQKDKSKNNAKKPQQRNPSKKPKPSSTTSSPSSSSSSSSESSSTSSTTEPAKVVTATSDKVETSKGAKGDAAGQTAVRGLRQKREPASDSTDVGEGRYIKGDPLKGYYDFVITEGSYKFWAAFQVGTALLIIYSTFAAIYYSKVNPLTSDYDYQDYLGAGRSMTGGDADFVDDGDASTDTKPASRVMDWLPRTAHSLKFILDAIDKLPLDHDQKAESGWSTGSTDTATSEEATGAMK
ncbi:CG6785 [Drosophila busckii]|uniref:CG6785 n=1 Tax=Drosophila busckii TaxID=30019 RepID=A0A0M4EFU9_DROBS|nr:CG6785 [Drosophila busckii]